MNTTTFLMDLSSAFSNIHFHTSLREPIKGLDENELRLARWKVLAALLVSSQCPPGDSDATNLVNEAKENLKRYYRMAHVTEGKFAPDFIAHDDYSAIRACVNHLIKNDLGAFDMSR